jgi:hypothetical protein
MEKEASSLPETWDFPKERQKLIYFRFQIDVLNIDFTFHFIEIAHYCTGFLALMERYFYRVISSPIKDIVNSRK